MKINYKLFLSEKNQSMSFTHFNTFHISIEDVDLIWNYFPIISNQIFLDVKKLASKKLAHHCEHMYS